MAGQSLIIAERDVQATSVAAMRGTIYQARHALSKHLRDDQQDYHDLLHIVMENIVREG